MQQIDVAVIGAGYAGAATAWGLAQHASAGPGRPRVVIFEREARAGNYASGRNAGIMRTVVGDPAWGLACTEALAVLRGSELAALFAPLGCVLTSSDPVRLATLARLAEAQGAAARYVGLELIDEEWGVGAAARATLAPQALLVEVDGAVNPHELLSHLLARAQAAGTTLALGHGVTALARETHGGALGWRVQTAQGAWFARVVVNAAGSWCDELIAAAALPTLGFVPIKRHIMRIEAPATPSPLAPKVEPMRRRVWWHVDASEHYIRAASPGHFVASTCDATPTTAADYEPNPAIAAVHRAHVEAWWPWLRGGKIDSMACLRTFGPAGANGPAAMVQTLAPGFITVGGLGGHGATVATLVGIQASARVAEMLG